MVTASYVSPALRDLHSAAVSAGISIMNEVGLDPGIDHMSALKTIHEVSAVLCCAVCGDE
jgi:saccharopine dehydrogenase-like NADP-dependent oxidoreductase